MFVVPYHKREDNILYNVFYWGPDIRICGWKLLCKGVKHQYIIWLLHGDVFVSTFNEIGTLF